MTEETTPAEPAKLVIPLTPCTSSQLEAYGYDAPSRTLAIRFNSGLYHYFDVPPEVYAGMESAESKGSYLIQKIKKAGFSYQKQ